MNKLDTSLPTGCGATVEPGKSWRGYWKYFTGPLASRDYWQLHSSIRYDWACGRVVRMWKDSDTLWICENCAKKFGIVW